MFEFDIDNFETIGFVEVRENVFVPIKDIKLMSDERWIELSIERMRQYPEHYNDIPDIEASIKRQELLLKMLKGRSKK